MPFTRPVRRISQSLALCAVVAILCNVVFTRQSRADDPVLTLSQVAELYDKMEAADRRLPRDTFDPRAIIETVGRDPTKLFEWVQSNTILLPYRGALRGPAGVLMDRGGSSLDRALLLATLLQSIGWEVRLANATLPKDQAQELLDQIYKTYSKAPELEVGDEVTQARKRVSQEVDQLIKLIGDLPSDDAAVKSAMVDALADHWWVQRHEGNKWIDLELSNIPVKPPTRTIPFTPNSAKLPLDSRDCHEVIIRVTIEFWKGGRLGTQPVLTQTFRPAETLGTSISFTHYSGAKANGTVKADGESVKAFTDGLLKQDTFVPILLIGSRAVSEASFTISGDINRNPRSDRTGGLARGSGNALGMSGGILGGGDGAKKENGAVTAEWIEFEIHVPGRPAQIVRREIFDLIGPAQRAAGVKAMPQLADDARLRRALALAGRSRILLQPCDLSLEFLLHDSVRTDLRDRALWLGIAQGSAIDPRTLRIAAGKIMLRDNVTPAVVAGRLSLDVGAMRTCIDQPNIIQYRRMLQVAADGAIAESRAVDLAFTSCAAIGVGADGFRARIGKGVADTWAEFMALGAGSRADENAATLFESASSTSAAPVILRPAAAAPDLSALRMPPDARERLRADLSGGNVVVAFGAKDRWGWWRIDPHTGQTVGVMDNGLNGAMTDREILENDMVLLSEELGEPITENGLRNASESELRRLAAKAKSVSPDRMFMDLQQMQREIWGCDMQGLIRGSGMRG